MRIDEISRRVCALNRASSYEEVAHVLGSILRSVTPAREMSDKQAVLLLDDLCLKFRDHHSRQPLSPESVTSFVDLHEAEAPMLSVHVDRGLQECLVGVGYTFNGTLRVAEVDVALDTIDDISREFRRQMDALGPNNPLPTQEPFSEPLFVMERARRGAIQIHHIHDFGSDIAPALRHWDGPEIEGWQMDAFLSKIETLSPMSQRMAFCAEAGRGGFKRLANDIRIRPR